MGIILLSGLSFKKKFFHFTRKKVRVLGFLKLVGRSCQSSIAIEDTDCFPMSVLAHGL